MSFGEVGTLVTILKVRIKTKTCFVSKLLTVLKERILSEFSGLRPTLEITHTTHNCNKMPLSRNKLRTLWSSPGY